MSWWATLEKDGKPVEVDRHEEGGTFALGGTPEAELNVTYNYGGHFREAWPEEIDGSGALRRMLDGRTGEETAPLLAAAVERLGTKRHSDYWEPTPGNAGRALDTLWRWAEEHPDATWRVR